MKFLFKPMIIILSMLINLVSAEGLEIHTSYYIDEERAYTIETIQHYLDKFEVKTDTSFGLRTEPIWIYLKLFNPTDKKSKNVIRFPYTLLDYIYVYEYQDDVLLRNYTTGDLTPFDTREINTNDFVIPYSIEAQQSKEFIFKIDSSSALNLKMDFLTQTEYHIVEKTKMMILGFYYGATILMLIYNFILYLMIKNRIYIDYVIFHFVFLFLQLGYNGLVFQYVWPDIPEINLYFVPVFIILVNYFTIQFSQSYLNMQKLYTRIYRYLQVLKYIWLLILIMVFFVSYAVSIKIISSLTMLFLLSLLLASLYIFYKERNAWVGMYILAWFFLFMGVLLIEFKTIGLLPVNLMTEYGLQMGAFLELSLLSFALAYRYNTLFQQYIDATKKLEIFNKELEHKVQIRTEALIELNNTLEDKIYQAVHEIKEKNTMLQQRSKLASMGEMIGSIAHQWRQPLAVSNLIVSILKESNNMNKLTKEYMNIKLQEIENNNMHMSQTIEDFLSYFSPKKAKEKFFILDVIQQAQTLLKMNLAKEHIDIYVDVHHTIELNAYKDEYLQVLLTILTNAIQAFSNTSNRHISISAEVTETSLSLSIEDTAGGIPTDIIERIFEPYFTTKHEGKGTGIGLYIAKMLIENSMGGLLEVQNTKEGAMFTMKSFDNEWAIASKF
ncbi:MAG: sensor histidine kinase [Sulfurovum sp.]|nr:sensor histidine kinase [Sulfurovum sp.]